VVGGSTPGSSVRRYHLLYWGSGRIARTMDDEELFQALESLMHRVVAVGSPRRVFVRAAVVGWHGQALLICGPPFSGKTTLAEALIRAGATYYSDQYAVLDAHGRVHAYPKPLTWQNGDGPLKRCPVETLGGQVGSKPLPVGMVLLTHYEAQARWRPRRLLPAQAVLALLTHTVPARLRPKFALAALRRVAASATTFRGKRGEAADTVSSLLIHVSRGDHDGPSFQTSRLGAASLHVFPVP
jgi:hypothetical protein